MELPLEVQYTRPLISIQDLINFIDKGNKYLKSENIQLTDEEQLEFLQAIILSPDYQREYRSKGKEESSIIESILLGIPIPEIFLVRTGGDDIQLRHVMDGQHRLTAIYRYVKDKFALNELEITKDDIRFKGKKFSTLDKEYKIKILGSHLSILEFGMFNDDKLEIELFKRYNRNTKPLEKHEISIATFYSKTSLYITNFLNKNMEHVADVKDAADIVKIYNITSERKKKQKNHQEICIILSLIMNGPCTTYTDGVEIANKYLEMNSSKYKLGEDEKIDDLKKNFDTFNMFLLEISKYIEYPLSVAIFKSEERRTTKFHTGVAMILSIIYYYFDIELESEYLLEEIQYILSNSPIGDNTYNASSTSVKNIMNYLNDKNKCFDKDYKSLKLKECHKTSRGNCESELN